MALANWGVGNKGRREAAGVGKGGAREGDETAVILELKNGTKQEHDFI